MAVMKNRIVLIIPKAHDALSIAQFLLMLRAHLEPLFLP